MCARPIQKKLMNLNTEHLHTGHWVVTNNYWHKNSTDVMVANLQKKTFENWTIVSGFQMLFKAQTI